MRNLARLGDICRFQNGRAFKKSEWAEKGLPIIRIQNLNRASAPFNYFSGEYDRRIEVSDGDLLFSWSGTVGSSFGPHIWSRGKGLLNQHIFRVSLNESVDKQYAYYALLAITSEIEKNVSGAVGLVHVTQGRLKDFRIPLPPLAEQKRIVTILDDAFAGIATAVANTEKNLANARELFESYLNAIFSQSHEGWLEKPLGEFATSVSTGPFGSLLHKADYVSDGVPLVNPINIVGGTILPDNRKMISDDTKKRLQAYVLQAGDVVIARRGEIGRCAVITEAQAGWVCGTGCFFIRPADTMDSDFLANLLRSARYRGELERLSTGATMLNLSNTALSNLRVLMPGLAEQRYIVDKAYELFAQCQGVQSIYQQKLNALSELRLSLLQKAFSGELTSRPQAEVETALA